MIISVLNQKGGSGKSTLSTNLAAMFAADGKEVLLVDGDPQQQTALNWVGDRSESLPKIHGCMITAQNLLKEASILRQKWEIVIVDGGARIGEYSYAGVNVSDFVIIPCRPSRLDLDSSAGFIEAVKQDMTRRSNLGAGILLTMVQPQTTVAAVARKQLSEWSFPVFETEIGHRVSFVEAAWNGLSVLEHDPKGQAASDIRAFYKELLEVMK